VVVAASDAGVAAGSGVVVGGPVVGAGCAALVVGPLVVGALVVVAKDVMEVEELLDGAVVEGVELVALPPVPSPRVVVAELTSPTEVSAITPMATTQSAANTSTRAAMRREPSWRAALIWLGSSCS
jgi:hypothetical protein